jgi:hypothetical protein
MRAPTVASRAGAHQRSRLRRLMLGLAFAALVVTACSSSFDPTGPCTADGSAPGAYPELEAQVPHQFRGAAPVQVDSGRSCTTDGLGTLAGHGITELRFAGATWQIGTDSGLSLATFTSPGSAALQPEWLSEFYETGARSGKNVQSVDPTTYPVAPGITGNRIDVLNGESFQSVVVWQREGRVEAALVADFIREIQTKEAHDVVVRDAVNAWVGGAAMPPPSPASGPS